ncbi:hypothetical protein HPO96_14120 [Kribbella sandramycini]|uniref:Lipoprotein LpqN n=1 Tax=Kribbella sandramycini TaxID=60450 RepID=A0A7Y4KZ77_9ACTN|nr:hypothetical protein [Kribbella sandramycini]MBB6565109.1 hypothetical protein [Kribbella sandramycini]NOL41379.1 hypothetical protein [Kribbella sandramycini]
MKRSLLGLGLLLVAAVGGAGGYLAGESLPQQTTSASEGVAPLEPISIAPIKKPLPVKTPVPSDIPALQAGMNYGRHSFTVIPGGVQVRLALETPNGWKLTRDPKSPGEVKFLEADRERGIRVEAIEPVAQSTDEMMAALEIGLKQSQPPENDVRILGKTTARLRTDNGERTVSTLTYTYIPNQTVRMVIVRWVALDDDNAATVEMSISGLPQDAAALKEIASNATRSVRSAG